MSSMLSTVSKEFIQPKQVMSLPMIDNVTEAENVKVSSDKEALEILKYVRGY